MLRTGALVDCLSDGAETCIGLGRCWQAGKMTVWLGVAGAAAWPGRQRPCDMVPSSIETLGRRGLLRLRVPCDASIYRSMA